MNVERFTQRSQQALVAAQRDASSRAHQQIAPEHLLLALLADPDGVVSGVLARLGHQPAQVRAEVEEALQRLPRAYVGAQTPQQAQVGPSLARVLERAEEEMRTLSDEYVSTEHLLLAMLDTPVLRALGVDRDGVLRVLAEVRGS